MGTHGVARRGACWAEVTASASRISIIALVASCSQHSSGGMYSRHAAILLLLRVVAWRLELLPFVVRAAGDHAASQLYNVRLAGLIMSHVRLRHNTGGGNSLAGLAYAWRVMEQHAWRCLLTLCRTAAFSISFLDCYLFAAARRLNMEMLPITRFGTVDSGRRSHRWALGLIISSLHYCTISFILASFWGLTL